MPFSSKEREREYRREYNIKNAARIKVVHDKWLAENPDKRKKISKRYYENNKSKCRIATDKWKENNIEKARQFCRNYREADVERARARCRKWAKDNPAKNVARTVLRATRKLRATPKWLTKEHLNEILEIYSRGNELGLDVDHIVPLRGIGVCGLHAPWNLQLLTRLENQRKGNRMVAIPLPRKLLGA